MVLLLLLFAFHGESLCSARQVLTHEVVKDRRVRTGTGADGAEVEGPSPSCGNSLSSMAWGSFGSLPPLPTARLADTTSIAGRA